MFDDEMLTIDQVAEYLKLKPQTIYKWAQAGKIPGAKFGKEWRFRRSLLEEWIDNHLAPSENSKPPAAPGGKRSGTKAPSGAGSAKKKKPSRRRSTGSGPSRN